MLIPNVYRIIIIIISDDNDYPSKNDYSILTTEVETNHHVAYFYPYPLTNLDDILSLFNLCTRLLFPT